MSFFDIQIKSIPTLLIVRPIIKEGRGEKILLAAIIRRAAFDIALYRNDHRLVNRRIAGSAIKWMFSDARDEVTSFMTICDFLDQDPTWIRSKTMVLNRGDVKKFDRVGL